MTIHYNIADVAPYINWSYFYFAWQVKEPREQQRIRSEAEDFLASVGNEYHTHALVEIIDAYSEGDDIVLKGEGLKMEGEGRIPCLRQQMAGTDFLCLADFVAPYTSHPHSSDRIGIFATCADAGLEHNFDDDPYLKMMAQLLADRLAEATAERLHEQVRKKIWGYARHEQLNIAELLEERFQGIRPAVGYPSLPDASLNFILDRLLDFRLIGITLTESGAMLPHASVSGLMISHPQARYFSVGKIGKDQLYSYAQRRGLPVEKVKKFLSANI